MHRRSTNACVFLKRVSDAQESLGVYTEGDVRVLCSLVKGVKIRPDPLPFRNDKRRDFCSRYDGYGDFCSGNYLRIRLTRWMSRLFSFKDANVDKNLSPVPLLNRTLEDNPIFTTPILVIAGSFLQLKCWVSTFRLGISHNSLRMCLETLLMQPGILVENVIVCDQCPPILPLSLTLTICTRLLGRRGWEILWATVIDRSVWISRRENGQ